MRHASFSSLPTGNKFSIAAKSNHRKGRNTLGTRLRPKLYETRASEQIVFVAHNFYIQPNVLRYGNRQK